MQKITIKSHGELIFSGNIEEVKELIEGKQMDVNEYSLQDPVKVTALIVAANSKLMDDDKMVELLIKEGADPNKPDSDFDLPLHLAVYRGNP